MTRPHIVRHESDRGRWELATAPPASPLAGPVLRYVGYAEHAVPPVRRREIPSGAVSVIFQVDAAVRTREPDADADRVLRSSFVAGPSDTYAFTALDPGWTGVQVDLSMPAARRLLGVPLHEIANRTVDLADLLGPGADRLAERLAETESWADRFALLDRVLSARLAGAPPTPPAVGAALALLDAPTASVAQAAEAVGLTRQHLAARFRDHVGLSPKTVARVARFRRALRLAGATPVPAWADVALRAGYYDQAHLSRDAVAFAGLPPRELLRRHLPDGGGVEA